MLLIRFNIIGDFKILDHLQNYSIITHITSTIAYLAENTLFDYRKQK